MAGDRCELLCLDLQRAEAVRAALIDADTAQRVAGVGRALADPTRVLVAAALRAGGELCVCDLAWIVNRSQNLVSHHLRVLREAGLAAPRRDGKVVYYALTTSGEQGVTTLVAASPAAAAAVGS